MSEVLARVLVPAIEAASEYRPEIDTERMLSALPQPPARYRSKRGRIPWDEVAQLAELLQQELGGPEQMRAFGRHLQGTRHNPVRTMAKHFTSAEFIYFVSMKWFVPLVYPVLETSYRRVEKRRLYYRVRIPEPYRASEAYLHMQHGSLEGLPRVIGQDDVEVEAEVSDREGHYWITLPPASVLDRIGGAVRQVFAAPTALLEIGEQAEDLQARVAELSDKNRRLAAQAEALKRSEQLYRLLAENVTDVIWTMGMDQRMKFVSPSITRLRGCSVAQAMDETLSDVMSPESLPAVISHIARKLQLHATGDEAAWKPAVFEVSLKRYDGSTVMTRCHVKLTEGLDGELLFMGVTHDISEQKRAEADRQHLEEQLHHAQKMEAIGRLAGGVAHDFNNVLCAISGNASLALLDLPAGDPAREQLEEINVAADRAAMLTRQLLAFSRRQVIEPKPVDLSALIAHLHTMLARLIGEDVRLRTVAQDGLAAIRADPGQLEQLVLNLAINARDAMPTGGELVIATTETAGQESRPAQVMLRVSDTGCGMSAEVRERVFEPFFTTKELGQGTGLGLATVYGIVEQNGGRIEVDSEPGKGTSFKIYFPRIDEPAVSLPRREAAEPSGGDETVLVVEDEDSVRSMAVRALERLGYTVLTAANGPDALKLATEHPGAIDLLFTDVVMPRMNGRELADEIHVLMPDTKVLFASGYTQDVIGQHNMLDEGVRFLAKPYTPDALAARLRQVLDGV